MWADFTWETLFPWKIDAEERLNLLATLRFRSRLTGSEEAVELLSETHGALTYLMLEGTQGRADADGDSRVTVREIVDYAVREMPLLSKRLVMERISQLPVGYSRGENFALAVP